MMSKRKRGPLIFALNSTKRFGEKLGADGKVFEKTFQDGEVYVRPDEDIRGADVFVLQSLHSFGDGTESLGDKILKLAIFCNAAHHASARRITAVIPHHGYARQDRKTEARAPLSVQSIADILQANFVDRLLTMDPHNPAIQSAYRIPSDILPPFRPLVEFLAPYMKKYKKVCLLAPDYGAKKERIDPLEEKIMRHFKNKPPFELITGVTDKARKSGTAIKSHGIIVFGDIKGSLVVIPDDESSTGSTIKNASKYAKDNGAAYVIGTVVHNKLNKESAYSIQEDKTIDLFIVTDTICRPPEFFKEFPKFKELSVAPYFKRAIQYIHEDRSISAKLF
ncbi:MAG: ribose-phosphate diphosphokinase [Candidatus Nanoarchaeia archaeon]